MKISHRLVVLSTCGALAMLSVGGVGLYGVRAIQLEVGTLTASTAPLQNALLTLQSGREHTVSSLVELSHAADAVSGDAIDARIGTQLASLATVATRIRELDEQVPVDLALFTNAHVSIRELVSARLNSIAQSGNDADGAHRSLTDLDSRVAQVGQSVQAIAADANQAATLARQNLDRLFRTQRTAQQLRALLSDVTVLLHATDALSSKFRLGPLQERFTAAIDGIESQARPLAAADAADVVGADSVAEDASALSVVMPDLQALRRAFTDETEGLFALRLAVLDEQSSVKRAYRKTRKSALQIVESSAAGLSGLIDTLEFDIVVERRAIEAALALSSDSTSITAVNQRLALGSRSLSAELERLLQATDSTQLDAAESSAAASLERMTTLAGGLASSLVARGRDDLRKTTIGVMDALADTGQSIEQVVAGIRRMLASEAALGARLAQLHAESDYERAASAGQIAQVAEVADEVASSVNQRVDQATWWIVGLSMLGMILLSVISMITIRSIVIRLRQALQVANAVSRGHLDPVATGRSRDEVSLVIDAMRQMVSTLDGSVRKIRTATGHVSTGAVAISKGNGELLQRNDRQAEQLSEAAGTTSRISDIVRQSAMAAQQASSLSLAASEVAGRGCEVVTDAMQSMRDIDAGAREISHITSVIDAIALQTNILALNAAVEAGRAGESGRGFAVVASEVGLLARKSKESVLKIREIIENNGRHVESGSQRVSEAANRMQEVVSKVDEVARLIAQVSAKGQSQVEEISLVDGSVGSLERMTQQNAALSQQATAAAQHLLEQSRSLDESVSVFRLADK